MIMLHMLKGLVLVCLLLVPGSRSGNARSLFLVGGGLADDNDEIYSKFVELSGGSGQARIGVVTGASADPLDSADFYLQQFLAYGAESTYFIPVYIGNEEAANDESVVAELQGLTGIFFGGGDQSRLISLFFQNNGGQRVDTPVMATIRSLYEKGTAVVGGTSAGAAVMSGGVMVNGGMSYNALKYGSATDSPHADDLVYDQNGGFGLAKDLVIDTHFSQRGREGRMIRLLSDTRNQDHGTEFGVGIDENTAFIITSDLLGMNRFGEILGENGVFLVDVGSSSVVESNNGEWGIETVYVDYLREGDVFDLESWDTIIFADFKTDLNGNESNQDPETSDDIFYGSRGDPDLPPILTQVATSLFDCVQASTWGTTWEDKPMFQLNFIKGKYSLGFGGTNPSTGKFEISYQDLLIDIMEA
ncbi:hypothetical protein TCAL_03345 [Tigriopus californicus]|uniref:Cyanophycinase n=1 Tax=Tigriopus californicus TaxID=6832 RepID=A0A553P7D8_TIGCA|nr:cyanophycinase-like [Tigriopus californicus]TRY73597.1 hypothetical protein TCAL_03345 [Tigriopus californicus]|eukprot:TCALIF_03345-PA protein Name:"Similar to cphE Cyanophycinase (Pseudomonas anguilliseptica)" AED:0.06 eAED:0.06 QI:99/1/1/1/1/0.8/5/172/416